MLSYADVCRYEARGIARIPKHEVIAVKRRDFTPFTNKLTAEQLESFERHPEKRTKWERDIIAKVLEASCTSSLRPQIRAV